MEMLTAAKHRAKRKGVPFSLTTGDIVIPKTCPALGIPLAHRRGGTRGGAADNSPSLDRVVPERGYVPGNVIVISALANRIKNNATLDQLRRVTSFCELIMPEQRPWRMNPS